MFNQPDLEARLFETGPDATSEISLLWGHAVVDAGQDAGGAWVDLEPSATDGTGHRVEAAYVVGCDGANSTVRDLLGVTFEDHGFYYDWLVVDVELPRATSLRSSQSPDL